VLIPHVIVSALHPFFLFFFCLKPSLFILLFHVFWGFFLVRSSVFEDEVDVPLSLFVGGDVGEGVAEAHVVAEVAEVVVGGVHYLIVNSINMSL